MEVESRRVRFYSAVPALTLNRFRLEFFLFACLPAWRLNSQFAYLSRTKFTHFHIFNSDVSLINFNICFKLINFIDKVILIILMET